MEFDKSPAHNEFRSDTFTTPTRSMAEAMFTCSLGDAVYNEDKTTIELEKKVAKIAGKPAGLFCVSGTLSNQIALRTHLLQPPHSIMCDSRSHIYAHEAGGLATLSQAMVCTVMPKNGIHLTLEDDIIPNFVPDDGEIHGAPTKVISLENTLHGMIFPIEEIKKISAFCKTHDIKLHLDGARLWNASEATGISIAEYGKYFDSISLCLSKTLGAPIGSVLVGEEKFLQKANHFKKQNGGGIRQSGILASMASVAIDENLPKLKQTHAWAQKVGELCAEKGIALEHPIHTNFVFLDFEKSKMDPTLFLDLCEKEGIKVMGNRITFHYQLSSESIDKLLKVITEVWESSQIKPYEGNEKFKLYNLVQNEDK